MRFFMINPKSHFINAAAAMITVILLVTQSFGANVSHVIECEENNLASDGAFHNLAFLEDMQPGAFYVVETYTSSGFTPEPEKQKNHKNKHLVEEPIPCKVATESNPEHLIFCENDSGDKTISLTDGKSYGFDGSYVVLENDEIRDTYKKSSCSKKETLWE